MSKKDRFYLIYSVIAISCLFVLFFFELNAWWNLIIDIALLVVCPIYDVITERQERIRTQKLIALKNLICHSIDMRNSEIGLHQYNCGASRFQKPLANVQWEVSRVKESHKKEVISNLITLERNEEKANSIFREWRDGKFNMRSYLLSISKKLRISQSEIVIYELQIPLNQLQRQKRTTI